MKLFQQLLVAPAALGLMAPMAAQAADLNIDGVSDYSAAGEQVTSVSQFSDVYPTDWAYKALSDLSKRYGCAVGYPNGNGSITRYEAAALLNACLERISEVSDDVQRLVEEFGPELAVLKGKIDGFEARIGEMEAGQFSTTTKMSGVATFVVGGNSYGGDAHGAGDEKKRAAMAGDDAAGVSFNYDYKISLDTSFTGEDLLKSRLRAGNFGADNAFSGSDYVALAGIETAYEATSGADSIEVDRLYYSFPYNEDFTIVVGPKVRQDDMLAVWPSVYPASTVLDFFTYAGAPAAYNLALGGGAGLQYNNGDWDVSANYVSTNSEISKSADDNAGGTETDNGGGVMNEASGDNATAQIAYTQPNWGAAVAYSRTSGSQWNNFISGGKGTPLAALVDNMGTANSYAISAYWTPDETGSIPSVSIGWGLSNHEDDDDSDTTYESATTQSWSIGFEWEDAFVDGNTAGFALGQATHVTELDQDGVDYPNAKADFDDDTNWAFEWWYKIQVSDNISVTPAMFYLRNPMGDQTDTRTGSNEDNDAQFNNLGALVKTTFQF